MSVIGAAPSGCQVMVDGAKGCSTSTSYHRCLASILASEVSWGEDWYRTWYENAERYDNARNTKQRFEVLQLLVDASGKRPNRVKYTLHKCRRNVVGCGSGKTHQDPKQDAKQA